MHNYIYIYIGFIILWWLSECGSEDVYTYHIDFDVFYICVSMSYICADFHYDVCWTFIYIYIYIYAQDIVVKMTLMTLVF